MVQTTDRTPRRASAKGRGSGHGAEPGRNSAPPRRGGEAQAGARDRLVRAAGPLFAEQGFDAVSTRALARAARVNLSAITYHFGGKERLYRAVIQRLLDDLEPQRQAVISLLREGVEDAGGDGQKLARLASDFVSYLIGFLLSDALPRWRIQLMLREINQPSVAFDLIMVGHIDPLHDAVAGLVAAATGGEPGDEETRLLTQSVVGQCLLFGLGKAVLSWRLDWKEYTPGRIDKVVRTVTPAVLAALGLPPQAGRRAAASRAG